MIVIQDGAASASLGETCQSERLVLPKAILIKFSPIAIVAKETTNN